MALGRAYALLHDRRHIIMKWTDFIWARIRNTYSYRHEPGCVRVLAESFWRAVLLTLTLVVIGAIAYGGYALLTVFADVSNIENALASRAPVPALNRTQLQATIDGFATRQANYDFLKTHPPKVVDPSK